MSKSKWIVGIAIAIAVIISTLFIQKSKEPKYHGRRLTDWLTEFDSWGGNTNAEVFTAIQSMGADAVPILVEMSLSPTDSKLRQMVAQKVYSDPNLERLRFPIAPIRWARANVALSVLGSEKMAAVRPLLRGLTNQDPVIRGRAATALGFLGPVAEQAVPALISHEADMNMRGNIMLALGMIGGQQEASRRVLNNALIDTNAVVARNAQIALMNFGRFRYGKPAQ